MANDRLAIFTICSNNYVPMAKVLIDSALRHHPHADMHLFIADALIDDDGFYPPHCAVVPAQDLDIPNFQSFAFRYDIMEFNTAIKPFCFLRLLSQGYSKVLYFDPDIEVFRYLDSVLDPLDRGASFVLTPHLCQPAEGDAHPSDITIMQAGIYNLGFLAVGATNETEPLLRWWARRLEYECISAQERGIFVDQKFMDLLPGFADHAIVSRDTSLNVAYWNLKQRDLRQGRANWTVDGKPLSFFHFSGFNPRNRSVLSKHTLEHRDGSMSDALTRLLDHYASQLIANKFGHLPNGMYAYGHFKSGRRISPLMRKAFREQYHYWPTDPFEDFDQHLCARSAVQWSGTQGRYISNLMHDLRAREPWLQASFDPSVPHAAEHYQHWWLWHARPYVDDDTWVEDISRKVGNSRAPAPKLTSKADSKIVDDGSHSAGIDVIGYLELALGLGEAGRWTMRTLAAGGSAVRGIPISLNSQSSKIATDLDANFVDRGTSPIQIFNVNADQYLQVRQHLHQRLRDDAYRIIVPFWELPNLPDAWLSAFDHVDEVWAPTAYIQAALVRKLQLPVVHMPLALDVPQVAPVSRSRFNLPKDKFLFFFAFDFFSFIERKNPTAIYAAFKEAFRKNGCGDNAALVLKTQNAKHLPAAYAALHDLLEHDPDVFLVEETLSREDTLGLIAASDAVISLHRSEGLGLLVAEAMALGKPVIATDYSATKELVTPATGYAVDYRLVPVKEGEYPFADGQVWAEADIQHAAWLMRRVYKQDASVGEKVRAAKAFLQENYGVQTIAARQNDRLRRIGA